LARKKIRVRGHRFSDAPAMYMKRTKFDRSHVYKTTFDSGKLIPVFVDEVLPGDTTRMSVNYFARLATPIKPIMDNIYLDWFFFFVPNRLVWEHWQNFCFEQEDPDDSTDYVIPTVTATGNSDNAYIGSLWDYFGLPVNTSGNLSGISALPFRGVYLIWNEWFRDENLQKSVKIQKGDTNEVLDSSRSSDQPSWVFSSGTSVFPGFACPPRGKRHDYFTSALPWTQKGPGVQVPLTGNAFVYDAQGVSIPNMPSTVKEINAAGRLMTREFDGNWPHEVYEYNQSNESLVSANRFAYADLESISGATISSLRTAFQMQKFYERLARGGSRYTEVLRSFFGVVSPDARLQRPEFLGSFTKMVNVNPIAQTSATDNTSPQGNLSAYGVTAAKFHGFTKSFVEHGFVIGVMVARYDHTYQQGLERFWSRRDRLDYYFPVFANIGEQPILNKEIYAQGTAQDDEVFGYQEAWADYRYKPSRVAGEMRSKAPASLDVWHLADEYTQLPKLSDAWIREDKTNVDRVLAVTSSVSNQMFADLYVQCKATRPMPMYSIPGLIDHH